MIPCILETWKGVEHPSKGGKVWSPPGNEPWAGEAMHEGAKIYLGASALTIRVLSSVMKGEKKCGQIVTISTELPGLWFYCCTFFPLRNLYSSMIRHKVLFVCQPTSAPAGA